MHLAQQPFARVPVGRLEAAQPLEVVERLDCQLPLEVPLNSQHGEAQPERQAVEAFREFSIVDGGPLPCARRHHRARLGVPDAQRPDSGHLVLIVAQDTRPLPADARRLRIVLLLLQGLIHVVVLHRFVHPAHHLCARRLCGWRDAGGLGSVACGRVADGFVRQDVSAVA